MYSSFKAMEMIQGILGFEIFSSGILEGRGREILETMFWGVDVLSQDFLKHISIVIIFSSRSSSLQMFVT